MQLKIRLAVSLVSLVGCAASDAPVARSSAKVHVTGTSFEHLRQRGHSLVFTESATVQSLDLGSNRISPLSPSLAGVPWGLVELGDRLVVGVDGYCPGPDGASCVSGLSLVQLDPDGPHVLTVLDELWDPHSIEVVGDRMVALSSGLFDPSHSVGCDMSQLLEVDARGGHRAVGPIVSDARRAVQAFGGIAYSISRAPVGFIPNGCAVGDVARSPRSIELYGTDGLATLAVSDDDARAMWLLGGTDDTLWAARPVGDGSAGSDVLAIDRAGRVTVLGRLPAAEVPIMAVAQGNHIFLGILRTDATDDPERCGGATPCQTAGESIVRTLARTGERTAVDDVVVAQRDEYFAQLLVADNRLFAATSRALVEVDVGADPGME